MQDIEKIHQLLPKSAIALIDPQAEVRVKKLLGRV
jgi:hypothetical protein